MLTVLRRLPSSLPTTLPTTLPTALPTALRHRQLSFNSFLRPISSAVAMPSSAAENGSNKVLTIPEGMNKPLQKMEYAVRGALVQRAEQLSAKLNEDAIGSTLPFDRIVYCNIGNPQSVGQLPLTFGRQVISVLACPSLLDAGIYPKDVLDRARAILQSSHGAGAYTASPGLPYVRQRVVDAITERDGVPSSIDKIFLTNGASDAAKTMLALLVRESTDGVMIPIPQYPLYSATMTALQGTQVPYYLNEEDGWGLSVEELQRSLEEAQSKGVCVRAIVVINPGNPTGQVLTSENQREVVRFCERNGLVILADEVYQKNVYVDDKPFTSFKKIVANMGSEVELASFHSVSKGVLGECGIRGGYMEIFNLNEEARNMIYKVQSVSLCSNVIGQAMVELMLHPPGPDDPSYKLYKQEVDYIFNGLKRKSRTLQEALNSFEGVHCNRSEGAMYLFPRITIPQKAVEEAERRGLAAADVLYCFELLESTGICVVPGSGFGQREGTYHFRTTFLPPEAQMDEVVNKMRTFHQDFLSKYGIGDS